MLGTHLRELLLERARLGLEAHAGFLLAGDLRGGLGDDGGLLGDDALVARLDLLASGQRGLVCLERLGELLEAPTGGGVSLCCRAHVPHGRYAASDFLCGTRGGPARRAKNVRAAAVVDLGLLRLHPVLLVRHRGSSR